MEISDRVEAENAAATDQPIKIHVDESVSGLKRVPKAQAARSRTGRTGREAEAT